MKLVKSQELFQKAQKLMPGGVNSPVRAFKSVGLNPPFIKKGLGSKIYDEDGNEYIDYVGSWGPLILGHSHPEVTTALQKCISKVGTSFGAPTELEVIMAELITKLMPSIEMVRMVNSGTEATMSALRLARGYTGRDKIIKFEGCYHGHADHLLIKAGSGALTFGVPTSPGIPANIANNTIVAPYNNIGALEEIFAKDGENIAGVIIEPVAGNMGCVPPQPGFLQDLRNLTTKYGALLIFDEVMTGFRVSLGGAQERYGITPDLTCLAKIIGGGLPVGAFGGKREIMEHISPAGPIYQAGTLSGNPLAMTAGITTLRLLALPGVYEELEEKAAKLEKGLREAATEADIEVTFNRVGAMSTTFFTNHAVVDFDTALTSNLTAFTAYFKSMLEQGIYLAPSQFEAGFISLAHSDEDIERTVEASVKAFKSALNSQ
ncbi:glutamate-1-semialdehyde 2,1-aminomutase [Bacillota bacterium LX-D]|nr:glutamate-1-semialdehyde 2,1-aminomutase [Bacillota bacterium LX-D]